MYGTDTMGQGRCSLLLTIFMFFLINGQPSFGNYEDARLRTSFVGQNVSLTCNTQSQDNIWWSVNGRNITKDDKRIILTTKSLENEENDRAGLGDGFNSQSKFIHHFELYNLSISDTGNYSCNYFDNDGNVKNDNFFIKAMIFPEIVAKSENKIKTKTGTTVKFFCVMKALPLKEFINNTSWLKEADITMNGQQTIGNIIRKVIDDTRVNVTLKLENVQRTHNGTYSCNVFVPQTGETVRKETSLFVLHAPHVSFNYVKAVGAKKIFMNWTLNDGNDPVQKYFVQYQKEGSAEFIHYPGVIDGKNTSVVLSKFEPNSRYQFRISAKNSIGTGPTDAYNPWVKTLEVDPIFIPIIESKGNTHSSITIGWDPPPLDLVDFIQYYELVATEVGTNGKVVRKGEHPQNSRNLPYMFDNLKTATTYECKVRACSELTRSCGNWSEVINATTMDGAASAPLNIQVACIHHNISGRNEIKVKWDTPINKNGVITKYKVLTTGESHFKGEDGNFRNDTWGPKEKLLEVLTGKELNTTVTNVMPNTNYTIKVSAMTRSKHFGEEAIATCTMPSTIPVPPGRVSWRPIKTENDDWIFNMHMPRVSERNGPICCYRVYLVRIGLQEEMLNKMNPGQLNVVSYQEAHYRNNTQLVSYVAEVVPSNEFQPEIFLGDGMITNGRNVSKMGDCRKCIMGLASERFHRKEHTPIPTPGAQHQEPVSARPPLQSELLDIPNASKILDSGTTKRKSTPENNSITDDVKTTENPLSAKPVNDSVTEPFDGELDKKSKYTAYVEIIVQSSDGNSYESTYTKFFEPLQPVALKAEFEEFSRMDKINIIMIALLGMFLVITIILIFAVMYCNKNVANDEVISLRDSLSRAFCGGRTSHNHRHLLGHSTMKPADVGPILRDDLPNAYVQRHKDTDYGFSREYETLPNRFNDRTTKNSDAKENLGKNRYPDIKAYDQTRVKLSMLNGTIGSDYINANFVLGYKERKKFICAQGPMESTVSDFWRMIWEQHLEIIVMLTNLEEYNKAKCAKYWPEKVQDSTQFGDITVTFLSEQRYSDFSIRDLKMTRRNPNGDEEERRNITHYHYLVWKDFMAPEHPYGIIKFIRQINSVYSVQRGPILIHCSAGVGRTGTLVALDSLMQQLEEEGQVSIYNTVCDLRHQRNFLVQSLKQYIFLYRVLLDIAQFGNTELKLKGLSATVENLKKPASDSREQCKLEIEFDRIKTLTDDISKSCSAGKTEENRIKNRNESLLPYDKNRVILTPIPGRDNTTYINASFIEGYDNSESFIITQDPMENTISDFWRLISEQGIKTIVMISEIGDDSRKCPRYWADEVIQYDHIQVKYMHSESGPYFIKREFVVTNMKMGDTLTVTQFQYNGWPTVEGEVPEVTRGMIEIVDQSQKHHNSDDTDGPIAVHCGTGSDRSSIFVAMSILVQQLRTEKKIDICTVTRKLRSQRMCLLDTYAQYEFLHRAMVNYADLHNLSMESPNSDC